MSILRQAKYRNGRFSDNTASVRRVENGATFCNGYYDPMFYRDEAEAIKAFQDFIRDKECVA